MSSCVIRKEDQPACQPWQMDNFDPASRSVTSVDDAAVTLPTIEQITAIQEQARLEGYLAGQAEGREAGHAQMADEAARLQGLAEAFATQIGMADELISQQILDLAVDLAQAMLKSTLALRPELILPIVKEAVRYLPVLHAPALLYLNPGDAVIVKERIGDELTKMGWLLTEDTQLEAGGCRVDTANNQIDATLPTRWQRLLAAFGKHGDWLI